jgi:hypothetical protein
MKYIKNLFLLFVFLTSNVYATDTYNPANSQLTIPAVVLGNTVYKDVVITIGPILTVGGSNQDLKYPAKPSTTPDTYDPYKNQLTIPNVNAYGFVYYDVVINVGVVLSVGSSSPLKPLTAFASDPDLLPDLTTKYNKICGAAANMQNAIPVDLNNDGRKDLLLPLWCFIKPGQSQTGPVTNLLIALIQNSDGTFSDKTAEVFGTEYPMLDGKNQNWTIADFNNDGKPDIILGTDKEDGRSVVGNGDNMRSQAVAIMSGPNKYTIVPFGIPRFGDNVITVRNSVNKLQLLIITADTQVEMWEYNSGWIQIQNEFSAVNPIQKNPVFLNPRNDNKLDNTNFLVNNVLEYACNNSGCLKDIYKLELWSKATGAWTKLDEVPMLKIKTVQAQTTGPSNFWTPTTAHVATFEGKDYIDMGFVYDGCSIKINPTSSPIGLRSFLGDEIPGGYRGQTSLDANWRPPTMKIFTTEIVNNKLVVKPSIITEKLPSNYYKMTCKDLNNDGYDDIMIELGGGGALFYFNDKNGGFKKPKDNVIPKYSVPYFSFNILYADLNSDNIMDVLYYPITGNNQFNGTGQSSTSNTKIQMPLYKALRNIGPDDLN